MVTLYHGTAKHDWQPHIGACLTDDSEMAARYARWRGKSGAVVVVSIDLSDMSVEDRTSEVDRDAQCWPGDTDADIARLAADGVDIVAYDDEDEQGRSLRCYRIISARALAACTIEAS